MAKLRSPIRYFGGKGRLANKIIPLFPPHKTYVEPFGGGASVLLAKPPSPVEVYNDLDSGLVNFFRVLRNPAAFAEFYRKVSVTPYSREEYNYCRDTWGDPDDDIECAYRWFVVARQSFSGNFGHGWGVDVRASSRGIARECSAWLSAIDMLPEVSSRLLRVQIEHSDFRRIFETYDTEDALFYVDPPYVRSTRRCGGYAHEMSDDDHKDLIEILLSLRGKAVVSGYDNEIYRELDAHGWARKEFVTSAHSAGRTKASGLQGKGNVTAKQKRTEIVWLSPNCEGTNGKLPD